MVEILNSNIIAGYIQKWNISDSVLAESLSKVIPDRVKDGTTNVVFSTLSEIKKLNLDYRNIDNPTDVLSFLYEDKNVTGEIYVCPEYVSQAYSDRDAVIEILRCIVHGFLHLAGEEHKSNFDGKATEPMFEKQESMLESIIKELKI
jgi:probable rRNA maturation factor